MKKIGFLAFGVILVIAILMLPKDGAPLGMKRVICEVSHVIEASVMKVYRDIRSFGTDIEEI